MTFSDIRQLVLFKLGSQVRFYPSAEIDRNGINPAQRLLCLAMPQLLRQRATHTVNTDLPFIDLRTVLDSNNVRLGNRIRTVRRVMLGNVSGDVPVRNAATDELHELRRVTVDRLAGRNAWLQRRGPVRYYWQWGPYWLGLVQRPIATTTLTLIYDAVPQVLAADADVPQVPEVYHRDLAEIATGLLLVKEGLPEGARGLRRVLDGLRLQPAQEAS